VRRSACDQPRRLAPLDVAAEEEAIQSLAQLAHAAESRAADIVAATVLLGRFRYTPSLGWLHWRELPAGGGHWDTDDVAEPKVIEAVRQYIDRTERDYRAHATFADAGMVKVLNVVCERAGDIDLTDDKGKPMAGDIIVDTHGNDDEKEAYTAAASQHADAR
jgi:hypothetical protein